MAVVDGKAYPVIEIAPLVGFYDYKNKYQPGSTIETCPAELSKELTEKMQLLEQEIAQQEEEADSIEQFILRAKKYPNWQEQTPAVLHDLVNRVYVSVPDKSSGHRVQDVHISLACIGFLPESIIAEMLTHASKSRTA